MAHRFKPYPRDYYQIQHLARCDHRFDLLSRRNDLLFYCRLQIVVQMPTIGFNRRQLRLFYAQA